MCCWHGLGFSRTPQDCEKSKEFILPENRTLDQKYHVVSVRTLIGKHERLVEQDRESAQFWMAETLATVNATHEVCYLLHMDAYLDLTWMSQHASMILSWIEERALARMSA